MHHKNVRMTFSRSLFLSGVLVLSIQFFVYVINKRKKERRKTQLTLFYVFMAISGAFKFRGASNAVFSLDDTDASKGVITHSRFDMSSYFRSWYTNRFYEVLLITFSKISGNHAAALALAANLRGIPAYIVIPKNAPTCKVENVKRYGGQIIWSEASIKSREETANKVWQETGAIFIHPYNDGRILR